MVGLLGIPSGKPASFSSMGCCDVDDVCNPNAMSAFFACDFVCDVCADLLPKVMPHCSHLNCGLFGFVFLGVVVVVVVGVDADLLELDAP